jgi:hypothetical protein
LPNLHSGGFSSNRPEMEQSSRGVVEDNVISSTRIYLNYLKLSNPGYTLNKFLEITLL